MNFGPGRRACAACVITLVSFLGAALSQKQAPQDEYTRHLRFLASDQLRGRGNGAPELETAARYIAEWFRQRGVRPVGPQDSYFQEFVARTDVELGLGNRLTITAGRQSESLAPTVDYSAVFFGGRQEVDGELVFAGFGITAPELDYDDYRGFDVRGKVVAVFQHEPEEKSETSRFAGAQYSPYVTMSYKAANAKAHGAAAVLVLTDPLCDKDRKWNVSDRPEDLGIPVARLSDSWSRRLVGLARSEAGVDLRKGVRESALVPFSLPGVTVALSVDAVERLDTLKNVIGLIPGTVDEYVLVGAHYDHLGLGDRKSLAPEHKGEIHNGADDNASGVAGLLKLASDATSERQGRGLLLVAFAAEELGLQGSTAFVSQPPVDLRAIRAMINLDMIGRSNGDLLIGGVGTAIEFRPLLESLEAESGLTFKFAETPQAASDHLPFSGEKIPVLFFFSGLHPDYHTPSDDWEKIDRKRTGQILSVIKAVTRRLRRPDSAVRFVETDSDAALLGGSVGPALLGLITAYSWESDGILVASVKPGTLAAAAGFEPGDIIVGCDGRAVFNRLDLIAALTENQAFAIGPHVITVLRRNEVVEVSLDAGQPVSAHIGARTK